MAGKLKLTGGPDKTVTWIWLDPETGDRLKVEYYDFSELAHRMFGNDIAYIITVHDMEKLLSLLMKQGQAAVLPWMAGNFKSYFDVKQWLEANGIDFGTEIEGWA